MSLHYSPYIIPVVISLFIIAPLAIWSWSRYPARGARWFSGLMVFAFIFSFFYGLEILSTSLPEVLLWSKFQYIGSLNLSVMWLFLVFLYTGREKLATARYIILAYIIPVIIFILAATNEFHELIWANPRINPNSSLYILDFDLGIGWWVNIFYGNALLVTGMILLIARYSRANQVIRRQIIALLLFMGVNWVATLFYVMGKTPNHLNPAPLTFSIGGLIIAWSLFRHQFFDIVPIAKDKIINEMQEGLIVLDHKNRVVDINPEAQKIVNQPAATLIGNPMDEIMVDHPELEEKLGRDSAGDAQHVEITLPTENGEMRSFDVRVSVLKDKHDRVTGRLMFWHDITERVKQEQATKLILRVTQEVNQAQDFKSALKTALEIIAEHADSTFADAFLPNEKTDRLENANISCFRGENIETLKKVDAERQAYTFARGEGLSGRVWSSGEPEWQPDVSALESAASPRLHLALEANLNAAFAVPVKDGDMVIAVMAFYMQKVRAKDQYMIDLISIVVIQLGAIFQNKRAEEQIRINQARYRDIFLNSPVALWELDFSSVKKIFDQVGENLNLDEIENYMPLLKQAALEIELSDFNQTSLEIFEPAREDHVRKEWLNVVNTGDTLQALAKGMYTLWRDGDFPAIETPLRSFQGKDIDALVDVAVGTGHETDWSRIILSAVDITERKQAETRLRDLFLTSPVALFEADFSAIKNRLDAFAKEYGDVKDYILKNPQSMQGAGSSVRMLDANLKAIELYEADDIPKMLAGFRLAISPDSMIALRDGVIALWEGENEYPIETTHKTLKGNKKNVVVRFSIRPGYEESWEYVNISVDDVTEQRAAEASARQLASAVEASASSIVITDKNGSIEYVNPSFERNTGYSSAEALGENPRILKSGKHSDEFYAQMWKTLTNGEIWQGELVNKKKNGELYWETVSISPIPDDTGKIRHYVAVKDDISKLKEAEKRISQQNEFLQAIMEGIAAPFYVLDVQDYSIVMANEAAKRSGIAESRTCYGMTHRLDAPCSGENHPCPIQHVVTHKKPFTIEHKHYREDGTTYDVEVHGYPLYDSEGNVIQMIEYSLDISARKEAERRAKRLLTEQIAVRKALEAITSSLDINTVLQQITQEISEVLDCTSTYLWRWDATTHVGKVAAEYFSPQASERERVSSLGQEYEDQDPGFIAKIKTNQHVITQLGETAVAPKYEEYLRNRGVKSTLHIPIQWLGETIAFIEIWESRLARDFTTDEINLCQHIANNAAVAINNAQNYEQAQQEIERRRAVERELRKLSNAVEQTASGIIVTNTKSVIEFANPAAAHITGYTESELLGQTPNILKSGMHAESFYEELWDTIQQGNSWHGELINRRKDGSLYWESQIITPVKDPAGEITHYVAVKEDITQFKETQDRLSTLSKAVEQAATGIVITDPAGSIEFINPAFTAITDYTLEEVIGKEVSHLLRSNQHEPAFYHNLTQTIQSGNIWRGEMVNRRKDGSLYWEAAVISPVLDEDGNLVHIVELKEDITARKELEQALALAHEEALVASDMKTQLLANVSHDMRTPLGAILGYTEMLQSGVFEPLNKEQDGAMRAISSSAQRLLDFVNNLLSQAQIDTGKIVLNKAPFNPERLVNTMGGELSFARSKGLTVETYIDESLPKQIEGDAYWLGQILHNLVSNAIKFTPDKGKISIEMKRRNEKEWHIAVSDTGKGIPKEAQKYIFESFRQVDGSIQREEHTGSGLGLSIVQHLVRLMDGEISLESELGKGSTFTVVLPLIEIKEK